MRILLTGGTGLIGRPQTARLLQAGHQVTVVTRNVITARALLGEQVALWPGLDDRSDLNDIDAVINLAGEPIADKRWSETQKQLLCDSRWQITERLASLIAASTTPPSVLISGSAVGFYGNSGEAVVTEDDSGHDEFTHRLCARWEMLALSAESDKTRVCLLRTGVVLSPEGGALAKMRLPFRLGAGGSLGSGKQFIPWVHLDDVISAIVWLLDHPSLRGPFNLVAPYPVRNAKFAATLGQVMHRPALLHLPASIVSLMMGESAVLVLGGQHAIPQRLEASGFSFRWYQLDQALVNLRV